MKQILTVFLFELKQQIKQKSFITTAIITFLMFFAATFATRFLAKEQSIMPTTEQNQIEELSEDEKKEMAIYIAPDVNKSIIESLSSQYKLVEFKSEEELANAVKSKKHDKGLAIHTDLKAKYYTQNTGLGGFDETISNIIKNNYKYNIALPEAGIDVDKLTEIDETMPDIQYEAFGRNSFIGYGLSYLSLMFLYFMILLFGQSTATNVAKEKSSRTMELLITNVKPKSLIVGKVLAGFVLSLIMIGVVAIALIIGLMINLGVNSEVSEFIKYIFTQIKAMDITILIVFALIGVTMYYFVYASFGSLVSKIEELPQALSPVTMAVVLAFMVPMMSMSMPDSSIMRIASIVPFTAPLAMPTRFLMTVVPTWEVLLSLGILILTTIILAFLSIKIYRQGTLNYGNRLNIWKALTRKND